MAAEAEAAITQGALRRIADGEQVENPVFQCVQLKPMTGGTTGQERFRLVWSDVSNFIQSMLATQLNSMIHDGTFEKGCLVRLKQYQQQEVKGKKILVVLDCEVLAPYGIHEKLGQPVALEAGGQEEEASKPQSGVSATGFYGAKQESQQRPQQPQQTLPSRNNNTSAYGSIYPIEALSPYAHKWTIKARCTAKTDIKTWHNTKGEGKLFSANFLDESGEIRATGFNEQVDNLYGLIQEGSVYYISAPCRVSLAKKQFSNLNNDYELQFERDTVVEKVESNDHDNVPKIRYNFINFADIATIDKDTVIDVIGIVRDIGEVSQITSKTTSKPYDKRELTLVDNSSFSIRLTLWGNLAQSFDCSQDSVIALKGVKVSDFGGRSLSLLASGSMALNPDIDESHKLKGWYDAQGRDDTFATHQNAMGGMSATGRNDAVKTVAAIHEEQVGMSEAGADYFTLKATVIYVKQDTFSYPACQTENCNKKVVEIDPGQWRCEKCDKTWEKPLHRYILSINVCDHTGQMWLTCFDDAARQVMGCSADELMEMKENDERAFVDKMSDANCRAWILRARGKMETFQDQPKVRYQVMSVGPINFVAESNKLTELLKNFSLQDSDMFVH